MVNEALGLFFPEELARIASGKCPLCDKNINLEDFKDELSVKEFKISGMCFSCQNEIFKEPE
jgi:hypothetical protein